MATQRMQVDNTAFLIEKLASDCAPLQYVRELTSNSIQAIQQRKSLGWSGEGHIIWDVDWNLVADRGVYKLQISDNGTGMTGPEIEQYINQLSSSGRIQDRAKNFGLGAKITGSVSNPAGLVYKSWVDGAGVVATLWKDPSEGYGLQQIALGGGMFGHYAPLSDEAKSPPIDTCGTAVVMLGGDGEKDHTFMPAKATNKWLIKYLNDRYFEFPDGIVVQVRNFQKTDRLGWPTSPDQKMGEEGGSQLRRIKGMKDNLDSECMDHGTLSVTDAKVHWWLLPEAEIKQRDIWESTGHCGALYQGEIYDFQRGHTGRARLREFGVVFGANRVVVYVEPDLERLAVYANTARSGLLVEGERLPWERWAAEFRAVMPAPIRQMMDDIVSKSGETDHKDAIRRRLREIKDLLKISRFRRTASGTIAVGGDLPGGESAEGGSTAGGSGRSGGRGGARGNMYAAFIKVDGQVGEEVASRDNIPQIAWISVVDGTREREDLEDRAARYIREGNMIQINADFRVFQDLHKYCMDQYSPGADVNAEAQVRDVVREWIELQLVEAVVGVLSLQGSAEWGTDKIQSALSEEALTTAVLPRYSMLKTINRALGAKLGKRSSTDEN